MTVAVFFHMITTSANETLFPQDNTLDKYSPEYFCFSFLGFPPKI